MGWVSAILFAVSMIVQQQAARAARKRQEKMEREAKERADAAKGFQLSVEGEAALLPIVYGRALVAGVRVFHKTSSNYVNAQPAEGGKLFVNDLNDSRNGVKHEFLTVQTALSFAEINDCYGILVDGRPYTDVKFNSIIGSSEFLDAGRKMGGHRFHVYPSGNVLDPLLASNYGYSTKDFSNTTYSTAVYALNRDDYQYNGVPEAQFFIEGLKVHSIIGEAGQRRLSLTKTYSNNPALCLLDYLTNSVYGRGLELKYIDLDSFDYAAKVCEKVVLSNVPKEGLLWTNKTDVQRDIKLYECNVALTPSASIRDNTEIILETMGQAELVWSGGKYKLSLEYPELYKPSTFYSKDTVVEYNNDLYKALINTTSPSSSPEVYLTNPTIWGKTVVAAYLTDDDIVRSSDNTVSWPNASQRLNFCTVRFLNEAKDFAEDSVSWPNKEGTISGASIDRGVWGVTGVYGRSDIVTYNGVKYQCKGNLLYSGEWSLSYNYEARERVLFGGNIYELKENKVEEYNNNKTPPPNTTYWTLIENPAAIYNPSTDVNWVVYNDETVYNIYRQEDYGLPLEADFFETGITDYYHALAKAEQRVRFSRDSTSYKFPVITKHTNLEPGDIIRVTSNVLSIFGKLIRIEEIKADTNGNAEITGSDFTASTLAWNVGDNEIVDARFPFETDALAQCTNLTFTTVGLVNTLSSGKLSWTPPNDIRVQQFHVKYTLSPLASITETTAWIDIGTTKNTYLELPSMSDDSYVLTVVADTMTGKMSPKNNGLGSFWPTLAVGLNSISFDTTKLLSITVYKRSQTEPETPTGGVFDFQQLTLTTVPTGWFITPPVGSDALYASQTIAETTDLTSVDNTLTWTVPALFSDISISIEPLKRVLGVGTDFDGNNAIFSEAISSIRVLVGNTDLSTSNEVSYQIINTPVNCTAIINNANGSNAKGTFSVTSLIGTQGSFEIRVTFRSKVYNFTISVIQLRDVYIADLTPPPTPEDISITVFSTNVMVTLNTPPSYLVGHGHQAVEVYSAEWSGAGALPTFENASLLTRFSGNISVIPQEPNTKNRFWFKYLTVDNVSSVVPFGGINGLAAYTPAINVNQLSEEIYSTYVATIYKQATALPETPTGGSYNFDTNVKIAPSGWSFSKPTVSTIPTYASEYGFITTTPSVTIDADTWSSPVVVAQSGQNGLSIYTLEIYSTGLTATPTSSTANYNFSTDTFTVGNLTAGWTRARPASGSVATYRSSFTFSTTTPSSPVLAGIWSTPIQVAQNGNNGVDGLNALSSLLSNEAHTIPTDSQGNNGVYTGSGTTIRVFEGGTELAYDGVGTANGSWRLTTSAVNITVGSITDSGTFATIGNHSAMTADVASITYTLIGRRSNGTSFTLTNIQTFSKAKAGVAGVSGLNAITAVLSNTSHTIPTDSLGNNGVYSGSGSTLRVYEGSTELNYDAIGTANSSWRVSATAVNITIGSIADSGTFATINPHSAMTQDTASITYLINGVRSNGVAFTSTVTQTFSKAKAGVSGIDATLSYLDISAPVIFKQSPDANTAGLHTSTTIIGRLVVGSTISTAGFITVTGNGLTEAAVATANTITLSPLDSAGRTSYTVKLYNQATVSGAVLLDTQVIPVVFRGATGTSGLNAITPVLSNEAHVLPSTADGTVTSYVGSGTQIRVYEGTNELNYDGIGTSNSSWTVSSVSTNITRGTLTDSGTFLTVGNHSGVSTGTDASTITYTITGRNSLGNSFSIVKTQSFSKSKTGVAGVDGLNGSDGNAYWLVSDAGAIRKSITGSYTPSTLTATLYRAIGSATPSTYSGRFIIATTLDGTTYTTQYTSSSDESFRTYTIPANIVAIRIRGYLAGGTSTLLDEEIIPIVSDGNNGVNGVNGTDAQFVIVTGEQVFKYPAGATIPVPTSVTLTASLFGGLTSYSWQYWNGSAWVNLSGTNTQSTYVFNYTNSAFTGNTLRIRCLSGTAFDELTLIKVNDGLSGSRGAGVFYTTVASATWSDIAATNRVIAVTGTNPIEGDTVTQTFSNTWSLTKIFSGGVWAASGQVIDGNLLVTGTVGANALSAGSVIADKISAGAVTSDKIAVTTLSAISASLGSISSGNITLNALSSIRAGQTSYATGNGFFLGYGSNSYRFSIGNNSAGLKWDGTSLNINGIIDGGLVLNSSGFIRGGQTNYNTGNGFWLGYHENAYKFSIGNPNGAFLRWTGTDLEYNGLSRIGGVAIYDVAGTYNWTIPIGISTIYVAEIIGGGGGGAGIQADGTTSGYRLNASGGGGAAYSWRPITLSAQDRANGWVTIVVGQGGGGGFGAQSGGAGGASSVGSYITASGGGGGVFNPSTGTSGTFTFQPGGLGGDVATSRNGTGTYVNPGVNISQRFVVTTIFMTNLPTNGGYTSGQASPSLGGGNVLYPDNSLKTYNGAFTSISGGNAVGHGVGGTMAERNTAGSSQGGNGSQGKVVIIW